MGLFLLCGAALLGITYALELTTPPIAIVPIHSAPPGPLLGSGSGHAAPGATNTDHCSRDSSGTQCQVFSAGRAAAIAQLPVVSAIALGCMTLVSGGLGWVVAGRVLRPVRTMTQTTRRISADNLHLRLAMPGPDDELKDLGDTIDGLLARLETAFEAQRRFVANASHELRTPLAMMRTSLDVTMAKPGPAPPELQALAPKLREGLARAEALLEGLLMLAGAQRGALPQASAVSLDRLTRTALDARTEAATRMRLQVRPVLGEARVRASDTLLSQMVENLLDNAIRHNEPGGWIEVRTDTVDGRARLVVENGGQRLWQNEVDDLTQPFRRLGGDRTNQEGFGLGLSIVAAIASAHRGSLDLLARPEGGLRALVSMPADRDEDQGVSE
jgi:signal transduction histidine kinase